MILVLIHASKNRLDRMNACRDTWVRRLKPYSHITVLYVLADPDIEQPVLNGDLLTVQAVDARNDLWRRTLNGLKWALDNTVADYIFKCDDDTYINVEQFASFDTAGRHYIGGTVDGYPGFLSGGPGYYLSRYAAQVVAVYEDDYGDPTFEDVNVGKIMTDNGIEHSVDHRFIPIKEMRPVAVHYASPKDMFFLDQVL